VIIVMKPKPIEIKPKKITTQKFKKKGYKNISLKKTKQTRANLLNFVKSLKPVTHEILNPSLIKKFNSQTI
jgi:hypothetical protein